jgi:diguanylate cyclase (GGDEF)-like protein/PAS domain S-box-containing protein
MGEIVSTKDVMIEGLDKSLYEIILDQSSDPIFCFDAIGTYLYINQTFSSAFGLMPSDIIGKRIWDVFPGKEGDMRFAAVKKAYETKQELSLEVKVDAIDRTRYYLTTVTPIMDDQGVPQAAICISKDITDRKQAEICLQENKRITEQKNEELDQMVKKLYEKSITDQLTSIFNRQHSIDLLEEYIDACSQEDCDNLSLMFIDLDFFKLVNDEYGHGIGDELLIEFSRHLRSYFKKPIVVGRYGGEEFIVVLPKHSLSESIQLAESFRQEISDMRFTNKAIKSTISIGVASYHNESLNEFIKKTDDLMYKSKAQGRNKISY